MGRPLTKCKDCNTVCVGVRCISCKRTPPISQDIEREARKVRELKNEVEKQKTILLRHQLYVTSLMRKRGHTWNQIALLIGETSSGAAWKDKYMRKLNEQPEIVKKALIVERK